MCNKFFNSIYIVQDSANLKHGLSNAAKTNTNTIKNWFYLLCFAIKCIFADVSMIDML